MFAHEKISCGFKSPLHFQTCNALPVFVGEFSLAIDNCMPNLDARFADYGQCNGNYIFIFLEFCSLIDQRLV